MKIKSQEILIFSVNFPGMNNPSIVVLGCKHLYWRQALFTGGRREPWTRVIDIGPQYKWNPSDTAAKENDNTPPRVFQR